MQEQLPIKAAVVNMVCRLVRAMEAAGMDSFNNLAARIAELPNQTSFRIACYPP